MSACINNPPCSSENVSDSEIFCYFVGARAAAGIEPCAPEHAQERFLQGRVVDLANTNLTGFTVVYYSLPANLL
jgi:hypothetical protein